MSLRMVPIEVPSARARPSITLGGALSEEITAPA
jgi:hypothetical protein